MVYDFAGLFPANAAGVSVGQESWKSYCYGGATQIYGNLVAGLSRGINLGCGISTVEGFEDCVCHEDTTIYNNTLIDNGYNFRFENRW